MPVFNFLYNLIKRHPLKIIILYALITAFFGYFCLFIDVGISIDQYLVKNHPAKLYHDRFTKTFFQGINSFIVIKADDVFDSPTMNKITRMTDQLSELNGVIDVLSLSTVIDIKRKEMKMRIPLRFVSREKREALLRKEIMSTELFRGGVVNSRGTVAAITVNASGDTEGLAEGIEKIIESNREPEEIYQIGIPIITYTLGRTVFNELMVLSPLSMLVFALVLFLCFKNLRGISLPIIAVVTSIIWTMGLMSILGIVFSMMSMILPVLMIAIGNAYAMHLVTEYFDHSRQSQSRDEVIHSSLRKIMLPVFLTAATTIIGFASLQFTKIESIQEFSYLSCFGLFVSLLVTLTLVPAILLKIKLPKKKAVEPSENSSESKHAPWIEKVIERIILVDRRHPMRIFIVSGIISVVAIVGTFGIHIETDVLSFFKKDHPLVRNFNDIRHSLSGSTLMNVVITSKQKNYFKSLESLQTLDQLQRKLNDRDLFPKIGKTISICDFIKVSNLMSNNYDTTAYTLPEEEHKLLDMIKQYYLNFGPESLRKFVTDDFSQVNIICSTSYKGTDELLSAEDGIRELFRKNLSKDLDIRVTGLPLVAAHSAKTVTEGQVKSLSFALVSIFIIMSLLFMSMKAGLLSMVPNMLPIIINFGIMGLFGIPLSSVTSLLASIAIGISVDDTIHYMARYNSEFKKDWDRDRAMRETLRSAGKPIIFTSISLALVFSVMMFSSFQPTAMFGLLIMITMVVALLGNVLVLPVMLNRIELVTVWDFVTLKLGGEPEKTMELFRGFSRRQVRKVLVAGILNQYPSESVIFHEGDVSSDMYAVIRGKVAVTKESAGQQKEIALLKRGQIFGEMALMTSEKRSATITAVDETELLTINEKTLERLSRRYPRTASKFYHNLTSVLSRRLRQTTDDYIQLMGQGKDQ